MQTKNIFKVYFKTSTTAETKIVVSGLLNSGYKLPSGITIQDVIHHGGHTFVLVTMDGNIQSGDLREASIPDRTELSYEDYITYFNHILSVGYPIEFQDVPCKVGIRSDGGIVNVTFHPDMSFRVLGYASHEKDGLLYLLGNERSEQEDIFIVSVEHLNQKYTEYMKTEIKEGSLVRLNDTSRYSRYDEPTNPVNMVGVVTSTDCKSLFDLKIQVKWANGNSNTYAHSDLILVGSEFQMGDVIMAKDDRSVIKDKSGREFSSELFRDYDKNKPKIVKSLSQLEDGRVYITIFDSESQLDANQFKKIGSHYIQYEQIQAYPGFPEVGLVTSEDYSSEPEFYKPIVGEMRFIKGMYVVTTKREGMMFFEGDVTRVISDQDSPESVTIYPGIVVPRESLRYATPSEVDKVRLTTINGHRLNYHETGIGWGINSLSLSELEGLGCLFNNSFEGSFNLGETQFNYVKYWYLKLFASEKLD